MVSETWSFTEKDLVLTQKEWGRCKIKNFKDWKTTFHQALGTIKL